MDPTARYANVRARITGYLTGLTIEGSPAWVVDGSHPVGASKWCRLSLTAIGEEWAGRYSDSQIVAMVRELVTVDLFWPEGDTSEAPSLYEVDKAADDIADGLRGLALTFLDYSSDPSSPSVVSGARLFVVDPPTVSPLPPSEGRARRQVTAEVRWFLRHAA